MQQKPTAAQLEKLKTLSDTERAFILQCVTDKQLRAQVLTLIDTGDICELKAIIQQFRK